MTINVGAGGGGATPPTSINAIRVQANSNVTSDVATFFGAQVTANVTSASLTEVLNITGKGILQFLMLNGNSGSTSISNAKIRVVIDGVEVTNFTSAPFISSTASVNVVGSYNGGTAESHAAHDAVAFNSSLVVEIASNGTNNVRLAYKRYLT